MGAEINFQLSYTQCYLHDVVPLVLFKKREKHLWGSVNF